MIRCALLPLTARCRDACSGDLLERHVDPWRKDPRIYRPRLEQGGLQVDSEPMSIWCRLTEQSQVAVRTAGDESAAATTHSIPDWSGPTLHDDTRAAPLRGLYALIEDRPTTTPSNMLELSGELSVGDTVTAHGQVWACESTGWRRIDVPDSPAADQPHP